MPQTARRPMPRIRKKASSNWLLDDTEADMESADPYADPFADPFARDDSRSSDSRRDWSQWDSSRQDSSTSQYDRRYGRESTSDPYGSRGQRSETWSSSRGSAYDSREDTDSGFTRYGSQDSSSYSTGQSPYGADRSRSTYSTGTQGMQESRTYGSSPDTGLLTTPYPQLNSSGSSRDSGAQGYGSERSRGYTPSYQSPYGRSSEQQQRSSPWGTSSSQPEQQEEYSQPSPLQKYQDKNKGFNPMRDDDYLKQIMPQN